MMFFDNQCISVFHCEFEECDYVVFYELSGDRTTDEIRKFVSATRYILKRLDWRELIRSSLCLYWNDKMGAIFVEADIYLGDLDLPHPFNMRA